MAPGLCVTSFRTFLRRTDLRQFGRRGLRLAPVATYTLNVRHASDDSCGSQETRSSSSCDSDKATPKDDLSSMRVTELKALLRERGLSMTGKKDLLIERLRNYAQSQATHAATADAPESLQHNENSRSSNSTKAAPSSSSSTQGKTSSIMHSNFSCSMKKEEKTMHVVQDKEIINHKAGAAATTVIPATQSTQSDSADSVTTKIEAIDTRTRATRVGEAVNTITNEVSVTYVQGIPHLTIPLPSRNEKCEFTLKPISHRVGDLLEMLKIEDRGIDRATILNKNGIRIASTCSIESLLDDSFWIHINDKKYEVIPPKRERIDMEHMDKIGDVKKVIAQLYEAFNVAEYQTEKSTELLKKLEELQFQLQPLEQKKAELSSQAARRTNIITWVGLGLMSAQFGILARLTWWEYSWDIMEPVTYFVTYGTTMAMYAYYCVTKQEYFLEHVKNREYMLDIYKKAKKKNFDIEQYNKLKRQVAEIEYDLNRLSDPLNMQLPPHLTRSQLIPPKIPRDDGPKSSEGSTGVADNEGSGQAGSSIKKFHDEHTFKKIFIKLRPKPKSSDKEKTT